MLVETRQASAPWQAAGPWAELLEGVRYPANKGTGGRGGGPWRCKLRQLRRKPRRNLRHRRRHRLRSGRISRNVRRSFLIPFCLSRKRVSSALLPSHRRRFQPSRQSRRQPRHQMLAASGRAAECTRCCHCTDAVSGRAASHDTRPGERLASRGDGRGGRTARGRVAAMALRRVSSARWRAGGGAA